MKEGEKQMESLDQSIEIVRTLKQVGKLLKQNWKEMFKGDNLTGPQGMLLGILSHCEKMKVSDLSKKLGLSNSTVSGIIDRVEKIGFVERSRSKEDRRVVYVNITPEYKKIAEERFKNIEKVLESQISSASPEELDKVLEGLNIFKRILEKSSEK